MNIIRPTFALATVLTFAAAVLAEDAKDQVTAAAKKLADQPNYSWKSTTVVPETAQFKPGPTEGKTERDGHSHVIMSFGGNETQMVVKGGKAAVTTQDGGWQLASELEGTQGPGAFLGRMARNFKTPAVQATDLVAVSKEFKKEGDAFVAELTEEGAKSQFRFGTPIDAKGSVKFWLKEGVLAKYEIKLQGKLEFNGNEIDAARTTTVEIKDVGTTKVAVPEDARKKLA